MSVEQQPCEVCGVPTSTRCSSCANAGIDLFLCSREHQKLVWKAHKPFCGVGKTFPIAVQPLTPLEIQVARTHLDKVGRAGKRAVSSLRIELESRGGMRAESVLSNLTGDAHDMTVLPNKPALVHLVRSVASSLLTDLVASGDIDYGFDSLWPRDEDLEALLIAGLASDVVSHVDEYLRDANLPELRPLDKAYSLLLHKYAMYGPIGERGTGHGANPRDTLVALRARARIMAWISAGMGTGDPLVASALANFSMGGGPGDLRAPR